MAHTLEHAPAHAAIPPKSEKLTLDKIVDKVVHNTATKVDEHRLAVAHIQEHEGLRRQVAAETLGARESIELCAPELQALFVQLLRGETITPTKIEDLAGKLGVELPVVERLLQKQRDMMDHLASEAEKQTRSLSKKLLQAGIFVGSGIGVSVSTGGFGALALLGASSVGLLRIALGAREKQKITETTTEAREFLKTAMVDDAGVLTDAGKKLLYVFSADADIAQRREASNKTNVPAGGAATHVIEAVIKKVVGEQTVSLEEERHNMQIALQAVFSLEREQASIEQTDRTAQEQSANTTLGRACRWITRSFTGDPVKTTAALTGASLAARELPWLARSLAAVAGARGAGALWDYAVRNKYTELKPITAAELKPEATENDLQRARLQLDDPKFRKQHPQEYSLLQEKYTFIETQCIARATASIDGLDKKNTVMEESLEAHSNGVKAVQKKLDLIRGEKTAGKTLAILAGATLGLFAHDIIHWAVDKATQFVTTSGQHVPERSQDWAKQRQAIIDRPLTPDEISRAAAAVREELAKAQEAGELSQNEQIHNTLEQTLKLRPDVVHGGGEGLSFPIKRELLAHAKQLGYDGHGSKVAWADQKMLKLIHELKLPLGKHGEQVSVYDFDHLKQIGVRDGDTVQIKLTGSGDHIHASITDVHTGKPVTTPDEMHRLFKVQDITKEEAGKVLAKYGVVDNPQVPVDTAHEYVPYPGAGEAATQAVAEAGQSLSPEQQWNQMQQDMLQHPDRFSVHEYIPANGLTTDMYAPNGEPIHAFHNPLDVDGSDDDYYYMDKGVPHIIDNETVTGKAELEALQKPYQDGTKFADVDLQQYKPEHRAYISKELFAHKEQVQVVHEAVVKAARTDSAEVVYHLRHMEQAVKQDYDNFSGAYRSGALPEIALNGKVRLGIPLDTKVGAMGRFTIGTNTPVGNIERTIQDQMGRAIEAVRDYDWTNDKELRHFEVVKINALGKPTQELSFGFEKGSGLYHQAQQWVKLADRIYEKFPADNSDARIALDKITHALERGQLPRDILINGVHVSNSELQAGDESIHKLVDKLAA